LSANQTWSHFHLEHTVAPGAAGLYSLIFAHCEKVKATARPTSSLIKAPATDATTSTVAVDTEIEVMAPENVFVNFKLDVVFVNPGPNYLSAGDSPLPTMYFAFFWAFTAAFGVWMYLLFCRSGGDQQPSGALIVDRKDTIGNANGVHRIHYVMAVLLFFKCVTLLTDSIRYYHISISGYSEGWGAVYYVFASVKGIMLFTVSIPTSVCREMF
jgi:hypothetical protein